MKLTFEQIKSITKGAAVIRENADGTALLRRFTDEQKAPYPIHDPAREFPCEFSGGITLDFYTDADSVTVTVSGRRKKKCSHNTLDLLIDNVHVQSVSHFFPVEDSAEPEAYAPMTFRFCLPGGEKRVTVQLHYTVTADSVSVELPDGASLRPYAHKYSMLAFGDSITHGSTAIRPCLTYVSRLGRLLDAEVHNYGIGGERFEAWKIVKGTYPACDFVTVAYGTNDFGHKACNNDMFSRKMPAFLKAAAEEFFNVPVFILLPLWRADENEPHNDIGVLQNVRDRVTAEAAKYPNMTVIDCHDFIPPEPKLFNDLKLHPNNDGMGHYANALAAALRDKI